jgi:hypothetical protein
MIKKYRNILYIMFLSEKEDLELLDNFCKLNPDACPLLADALIWCWKYHPEKYYKFLEENSDGKLVDLNLPKE